MLERRESLKNPEADHEVAHLSKSGRAFVAEFPIFIAANATALHRHETHQADVNDSARVRAQENARQSARMQNIEIE